MTEPRNSNQPEGRWTAEEIEQIRERARERAKKRLTADIPPMPSTVHNVHNQGRVIE